MKISEKITAIALRNKRYFLLLASLVPIVIWSYVIYGARALRLEGTALGVCLGIHLLSCVLSKYVFKKERMLFDLSFAITALLLALSLPWNVRYPVLIGGCAVGMVMRELFGGLGKNPLNPALFGRAFIEIFFTEQTRVISAFEVNAQGSALSAVLRNEIPGQDMSEMLLGRIDGNLGEISAILIIISALFLIFSKVITWQTPVFVVLSATVVSVLLAPESISYLHFTAGHLLGGGLLFCSVYFCTDPVTTPRTFSGRILFGALCGALAVVSRIYLSYECIYVLILLMGLWTPFIDRMFRPGVFGGLTHKVSKTEANG